jgi:hypothetical protein
MVQPIRDQFADCFLIWAARPTGRCLACTQEIGVQLPGRSTAVEVALVELKTEGSRIRLAGLLC